MITPPGSSPDLVERFRDFVARQELLRGVSHVLVGCSGGGDSVALLSLLRGLAAGDDLQLTVAHYDHGQRGAESEADAEFVRELAESQGLPFVLGQASDPAERASEAALRAERLEFFSETSAATGADAVALGHTLDDQAETVLFNLARGAARPGLAGMRPRRRVRGLLLLRPLLRIRRSELREFLNDADVGWRRDATNSDLSYTRNLIRARIVKELEEAVPGAVANIGRAAEILRFEEEWIGTMVEAQLELTMRRVEGGVALELPALLSMPRALQTRVVRGAIVVVRGDLHGVSREHVDAVLDQLATGRESARDLPGVRVRQQGEDLRFFPLEGRRLTGSAAPKPS